MKREIKFRAWVKPEKRLVENMYGFAIDPNKKRFRYFRTDDSQPNGMGTKVYDLKDVELMQFTGLQDKNGKDVYESDIVTIPETDFNIKLNCIVTYFEQYASFLLVSVRSKIKWGLDAKTFEIIGNIHENLLK